MPILHVLFPYYREIDKLRLPLFVVKGYKLRHFFTHRFYYIPKSGPDGFKLAYRQLGMKEPDSLWEIILYADGTLLEEFPEDIFFDDDLIWHQQHFGKPGQIATANLAIRGKNLYAYLYVSDLVQRISRRRELKTKVEGKFRGWHILLLNAVMNFALEKNLDKVYSIQSSLALKNTDPSRKVQKELFERIYDRTILKRFTASKKGKWWCIDVDENAERIVIPEKKKEMIEHGKTICLCHDLEAGLGHLDKAPNLVESMDASFRSVLKSMLSAEQEVNIKATYNVVGLLLKENRKQIEAGGHCIAFHSYNHKVEKRIPLLKKWMMRLKLWKHTRNFMDETQFYSEQLALCREVDYRIKGYRVPQSKITASLSNAHLSYYNFEWIASSAASLGKRTPHMQDGIVQIPVLFDDYPLHTKHLNYGEWEQKAIQTIQQNDCTVFCLHDCYAKHWLEHYPSFLGKIKKLGNFKTLDELAAEVMYNYSQ